MSTNSKGRVMWEMAQSVCKAIYESDFGKYLWMISPQDLDHGQSIRRLDDGLRFLYKEDEEMSGSAASRPGTVMSEAWGRYFFNFLRKQLLMMEKPILVQGEIRSISENEIRLELSLQSDEVYAPLKLSVVRLTDKKIAAVPTELSLTTMNNMSLPILGVSPEAIACEHVVHILRDLELIGEMEPYLYLYELLGRASIGGKELSFKLEEDLKRENIYPAKENMDLFHTYGSSSYMKKRWKTLLRRQKLTSPSWEETYTLICNFIDPVMESLQNELIYFGDWMANLGRYLD
ncbi:MAG: hypothetical protein K6F00_08745 [Lachnospiraceae bacterium]|nr:hypothetical protein [Lachnospiraceae bacterium]